MEFSLSRPIQVIIFYFLFSLIFIMNALAENEEKLELLGKNFAEACVVKKIIINNAD